jgi:hypothetical protein
MKKYIPGVFLSLCTISLFAASGTEPIKPLMDKFLSNDWPTVILAKEKIENLGSAGIPELIAVMNDCKINKLINTGDLIYPGATKFFGHGQIIDYDIDVICIRAGWLLEELTFINFGFSGIHLPGNELSTFIKSNFSDYYAITENQSQLQSISEDEKRVLIRTLSVEKAKAWWQSSAKQWTRIASLEQALNSSDEKNQVKALFYLRNGKTLCKGLNQKFYKTRLSKTVEKLSKSETNRVSENAKLIMLDSDFSWITIKPVN